MRGVFGVLGLLLVLAVVGLLAKRQMVAVSVTVPGQSSPVGGDIPQQQSQQIQKQIVQSVENSLQQARPVPDEK
jgi:hypothetical protein